jgi:hypothetical protein
MVALVARPFCARPGVMVIGVIAAMLYDLDGVQRHDRDVVAGNEANFGLGRSEAAAITIIA